jgi:7-cyano-7-deazaguanine synthase
MSRERAVVLLSGGLDSTTVLYVAKQKGFDVRCLIFDYGQRHRREIDAAKDIARLTRCPFKLIKIKLPWKGSALLDKRIEVPEATRRPLRLRSGQASGGAIPVTYVPARNTIFLSFALSYAEAIGASRIFIGANAIDFSGYPDCRPAYYKAFNRLSLRGTKSGVEGRPIKIETPLIRLTKAGIIKCGMRLGVPYEQTWSCYKGGKTPCKVCDSCRLRAKGFAQARIKDPA